MSIIDARVLEYIQENGSGSEKKKEEARIRYTPEHVPERRRELANRGLLQHLGNGVSVITEDGERYLNGEFDTGESVDGSQ
jgi:Mn-dependent DtxR family transcriptional regulator